jgi:branched-chain amino acid transport system permease protein
VLELLSSPPIAVTFQSFTDVDFWTSVGIIAGTYTIFALGLQLNVGFTGIFNFGQAAFMAIGAYSMAILTT